MEAKLLDISDEEYFKLPELDQSQIKKFLHNPADWGYERLHGSTEPTPAMQFGTAFHAFLLGTSDVTCPAQAGFDSALTFRNKEMREWRERELAAGRIVVSNEDMALLERMRDNIMNDRPDLFDMIGEGVAEQAIVWKDRRTGLGLKAKIDLIPTGRDFIVDLKTAASAAPRDFQREAVKYGYHIQALFYRQAVGMCAPELFGRTSRIPKSMRFWVFEKKGACDWKPYALSDSNPIMQPAKASLRQALNAIASMIAKARDEGLCGSGDDVDAAARYAIRHGYGKHDEEIEFSAWSLEDAELQNTGLAS